MGATFVTRVPPHVTPRHLPGVPEAEVIMIAWIVLFAVLVPISSLLGIAAGYGAGPGVVREPPRNR